VCDPRFVEPGLSIPGDAPGRALVGLLHPRRRCSDLAGLADVERHRLQYVAIDLAQGVAGQFAAWCIKVFIGLIFMGWTPVADRRSA